MKRVSKSVLIFLTPAQLKKKKKKSTVASVFIAPSWSLSPVLVENVFIGLSISDFIQEYIYIYISPLVCQRNTENKHHC